MEGNNMVMEGNLWVRRLNNTASLMKYGGIKCFNCGFVSVGHEKVSVCPNCENINVDENKKRSFVEDCVEYYTKTLRYPKFLERMRMEYVISCEKTFKKIYW